MTGSGPLAGVRIVELASLAPAPFGCMLLADMGAQVLRVDRQGDRPSVEGPIGPLDRGRRSIAVDLKSPTGVEVIDRLVRDADVLVEGFRPGVAERLGVGPDRLLGLNPRLIYARMTGWGQDGPLASRAGHDINYVALSGALDPLGRAGEKPHAALNLLGDFAGGGAFLAMGVLAALFERERSGEGQVIDAAMVDGASTLMSFLHGMHGAGLWPGERGTNLLDGGAPFYDTYATSDGLFMAVGAVEPRFHDELLRRLGIPRDAGVGHLDPAGWSAERQELTAAFATRTRDEWTAVFAESDSCVTPVLSPWEAPAHPHNIARGGFIEIDGLAQPAPAPRFSRSRAATPVGIDAEGRDPAVSLREWGLADAEIDPLLRSGAVA